MANKYELIATNPDGTDGALLAFAQQKRMAFKEQVTFYSDDTKTQAVFSFKARKTIDLGSGYDVYDADGQAIGWFKKEFGKSLLRSSWQLSAGGRRGATAPSATQTIAIVRRVWDFVPFVGEIPLPFIFHFDFTDRSGGQPVLSVERKMSVRDRYRDHRPGRAPRLPRRRRDDGRAGRAADTLSPRRTTTVVGRPHSFG